jgi:hypothetical protein
MRLIELVALPLAGLAGLFVMGAGLAALLGRDLPRDAQAALAPLCGAALVICASPLVAAGVPVGVFGLGCLAAGGAITLAVLPRARAAMLAGAAPLAAAAVPFVLAALPRLARGSWTLSAFGNSDLYLWASQARAFLHGPVAGPVTLHPDRLAYDRIADQGWAVALPVGDALLALVSGREPYEVYSALAVLVGLMVPLAVYVCARGCLGWSRGWSAGAAALLGLNAGVLYAGYYGWHGQLLGTAFLVLAAASLRLGLERSIRAQALAALSAAAALGSYRLPLAPVIAGTAAVVVAAYVLGHPSERRRALAAAGGAAALFAVFAAGSLVPLARGLTRFLSSQLAEPGWDGYTRAPVAQALGLVPPPVEPGATEGAALGALALVLAIGLIVAGIVVTARGRGPRRDFLLATGGLVAAGALVLAAPPFSPYLSMKLLAYGTPFLTLLALTPFAAARRRPLPMLAAGVVAAALVLGSSASLTDRSLHYLRTPPALAGLAATARSLPDGAVVSIDVPDPWMQAWAIYTLRDVRLSTAEPSVLLTGMGSGLDAASFSHPARYALAYDNGRGGLWRGGGLALRELR